MRLLCHHLGLRNCFMGKCQLLLYTWGWQEPYCVWVRCLHFVLFSFKNKCSSHHLLLPPLLESWFMGVIKKKNKTDVLFGIVIALTVALIPFSFSGFVSTWTGNLSVQGRIQWVHVAFVNSLPILVKKWTLLILVGPSSSEYSMDHSHIVHFPSSYSWQYQSLKSYKKVWNLPKCPM